MKCSRCGAQIGNSYAKINGNLLCENCSRELKIDEIFRRQSSVFDQAFPMLDVFPGTFAAGTDLDFANAKIRCARCGTTLRDIEASGQLGCIECYNTFNESILKHILKRQGSSEYMGRKPGESSQINPEVKPESDSDMKQSNIVEATSTPDTKPAATKQEASETQAADILDRIRNTELGKLTEDELQDGMMKAAAAEDYALAAKLRDELQSRKGDA
ncbi:MAG: hypothetical protein IJ757_05825 [Clostridiales bacterium]|nr:hypothetical protein [Clostridiales bacterium]